MVSPSVDVTWPAPGSRAAVQRQPSLRNKDALLTVHGRMGNWRKASYSETANCTEVSNWRKASFSISNGACTEVGYGAAVISVRDTMDRGGVTLEFPVAA